MLLIAAWDDKAAPTAAAAPQEIAGKVEAQIVEAPFLTLSRSEVAVGVLMAGTLMGLNAILMMKRPTEATLWLSMYHTHTHTQPHNNKLQQPP